MTRKLLVLFSNSLDDEYLCFFDQLAFTGISFIFIRKFLFSYYYLINTSYYNYAIEFYFYS